MSHDTTSPHVSSLTVTKVAEMEMGIELVANDKAERRRDNP